MSDDAVHIKIKDSFPLLFQDCICTTVPGRRDKEPCQVFDGAVTHIIDLHIHTLFTPSCFPYILPPQGQGAVGSVRRRGTQEMTSLRSSAYF